MGNPSTTKSLALAVSLALFSVPQLSTAEQDENEQWREETTSDGTSISKRHETGSVVVGGNLFVLGGRRAPPVEVYRPATDGWENLGAAPTDLHHFQPVSIGSKIYIIGAMTCCYPNEPSVAEIHVFDTANSNWSIEGQMPANRLRGGGGAVLYKNKIYLIGGNTQGHSGGAVNWFDEFNPANGTWKTMPNAPTARDHFHAVVVGNELVVTGGRQTEFPNPFANTVAQTNIFNFDTGQWRTGASIPTQRAGSPTVGVGSEVIVLGGEASGQNTAFDTVEAYDVASNTWRTLQPLRQGRHSGASGIIGNRLHMIGGSAGIGGGPEITSHESLLLRDVMGSTEPQEPNIDPEPEVDEPEDETPNNVPVDEPEDEPETNDEPVDEPEVEPETNDEPEDEPETNEGSDAEPVDEPVSEEDNNVGSSDVSGGDSSEEGESILIIDTTETDTSASDESNADSQSGESVDDSDGGSEPGQVAVSATGDLSGDAADDAADDNDSGGSSFGAVSWPVMVMFGGLLAWRRRSRH